MESAPINFKALLIICSAAITLAVILLIHVGRGLFVEYSLVSGLAVIGWLAWSCRSTPVRTQMLPHYIVMIVLLIMLNTFRYLSAYAHFVATTMPEWFNHPLGLDHTQWFVWMVSLPVAILLVGGYFVAKGDSVGSFFVWWGLGYVAVESLWQLYIELGQYALYDHHYFGGVLVAMILFYCSIFGVLKWIRPPAEDRQKQNVPPLSQRKKNLWTILLVTGIAIYGITFYAQTGSLLPVGVIIGSMMGGLICWRKTTSYVPADPYKVVPLYLLLQALFYIHVGEEVLTHFNRSIASISGQTWSDPDFDYLITFIGPLFWVFGAYSLWKRQAFGNFILWFMIVGMIAGEPTHLLVFPIVRMVQQGVGYEYFSGMYTSLFPMIPAILCLIIIVKDRRQQQEAIRHE